MTDVTPVGRISSQHHGFFCPFLLFRYLSLLTDNRMTRPSYQPWPQNPKKFHSKGCDDLRIAANTMEVTGNDPLLLSFFSLSNRFSPHMVISIILLQLFDTMIY